MFVEINRNVKKCENIEKYLDLLDDVTRVFENNDFLKCEWLIEELMDMKLSEVKTYHRLQATKTNIENAKREKCNLEANRMRVSNLQKSLIDYNHVKEIVRFKDTKAQESLKCFNELPDLIKKDFIEEINIINKELKQIDGFSHCIDALSKKLSAGIAENNLNLDNMIKEFNSILNNYQLSNYGSEKTDNMIEDVYNTLKGGCLLENKEFGIDGKSINTWENVISRIAMNHPLRGQMNQKTVQVRAFINKVENIKAWSKGSEKYDIASFKRQLNEVKKFSEHIDFNSDLNWAETLIKGIESRMGDIDSHSGDSIVLHELQSHLEYFKRVPLDLEKDFNKYQMKEKNALEFLKIIRQVSTAQLAREFDFLNKDYQNLNVIILEFEDIKGSLQDESNTLLEIDELLKTEFGDINAIVKQRDRYRELKFKKNINIEAKLAILYLGSLKQDSDARLKLDSETDKEQCDNLKPGIDYMVLTALVAEIDDLTVRLRNLGKFNGGSEDFEKYLELSRFVKLLYDDVQKHLESFIHTMNLDQITKQPPKKLYKRFVDLTGPIIDYKINLEIR